MRDAPIRKTYLDHRFCVMTVPALKPSDPSQT